MVSSFVITGFLGVGKTTMLTNSLKKNFKDKNIAIIVNEFGDIGVDSRVLKNVHSEVLEISEGCICCQLAEEFERGVLEIIQKYTPDIIFVETSGASEPFPISLSLQNLGISVDGILCVVDSKNFHSYKENITAKYQIGGSNIIVLNKTDLISEEALQVVEDEITVLKETYNIKNTMTGAPIFNSHVVCRATQGVVDKAIFEGIYKLEEVLAFAETSQHLHHTTEDKMTQQVLYFKTEVNFADVDAVLKEIPEAIYRVKGIVKVQDVPHALFVNYSFGDVSFEELVAYKEHSLLICIGRDIEDDVKRLCDAFDILTLPKFSVFKGE